MIGLKKRFIKATKRPEADITEDAMEYFGVSNLRKSAKIYNCLRHGGRLRTRRRLYREDYAALLEEHGPLTRPPITLKDGFYIDDSLSLPHLDAALEAADEVIAQKGGQPREKSVRGFFKDLLLNDERILPSPFLEFALSPDLLDAVCRHMKSIPVLNDTVPPGVRLIESTDKGQLDGPYRASQLYHLDLHDNPSLYVILLVTDVKSTSGPFTFVGREASDRVVRRLRYGRRQVPYRVSDEQMHEIIDREREEHVLDYPRGTVLFIDSQNCFHFGSRDCATPRYQLMCSYTTPCRTDFTDRDYPPLEWPVKEGDSRLRRMVLDRTRNAG